MKTDDALSELRTRLGDARRAGGEVVAVPVAAVNAVVSMVSDTRAADLIGALSAVDLVDCSPRMMQRRAVLLSRLRLDPADDQARAQADDLLLAAKLRRALHCTMVEALDEGDQAQAQRLRSVLLDAEAETLGWQHDAARALGGGSGEDDKA